LCAAAIADHRAATTNGSATHGGAGSATTHGGAGAASHGWGGDGSAATTATAAHGWGGNGSAAATATAATGGGGDSSTATDRPAALSTLGECRRRESRCHQGCSAKNLDTFHFTFSFEKSCKENGLFRSAFRLMDS
jgi:hypothetical protein